MRDLTWKMISWIYDTPRILFCQLVEIFSINVDEVNLNIDKRIEFSELIVEVCNDLVEVDNDG